MQIRFMGSPNSPIPSQAKLNHLSAYQKVELQDAKKRLIAALNELPVKTVSKPLRHFTRSEQRPEDELIGYSDWKTTMTLLFKLPEAIRVELLDNAPNFKKQIERHQQIYGLQEFDTDESNLLALHRFIDQRLPQINYIGGMDYSFSVKIYRLLKETYPIA